MSTHFKKVGVTHKPSVEPPDEEQSGTVVPSPAVVEIWRNLAIEDADQIEDEILDDEIQPRDAREDEPDAA